MRLIMFKVPFKSNANGKRWLLVAIPFELEHRKVYYNGIRPGARILADMNVVF